MAGPQAPPASLLGVDVGTAFTKAALFMPVEGHYRLIARGQARTTAQSHLFYGLAEACAAIEELTGCALFADGKLLAGQHSAAAGVETVAASISCQPPLHVLATTQAAASAALGEKAVVSRLPSAGVQDQARWMVRQRWDVVAGDGPEAALAREMLAGDGAPAFVGEQPAEIQARLAELSLALARRTVAGVSDLEAACSLPLRTGPRVLQDVTRMIASRFGLRLAIADCGASQATLVQGSPAGSSVQLALRDPLEPRLPVDPDSMRGWQAATAQALAALRPAERLQADLILGTGSLAHVASWQQAAVTLLDGLHPAGVVQLAVDSAGVVSQVAPLAAGFPDIACQIFERDALTGLGVAVRVRGPGKRGSAALDLRWALDGGPQQQRSVAVGELLTIPLEAGTSAQLSLYPAKGFDVGLAPGAAATASVDGGRAGLLVDARLEDGEQ